MGRPALVRRERLEGQGRRRRVAVDGCLAAAPLPGKHPGRGLGALAGGPARVEPMGLDRTNRRWRCGAPRRCTKTARAKPKTPRRTPGPSAAVHLHVGRSGWTRWPEACTAAASSCRRRPGPPTQTDSIRRENGVKTPDQQGTRTAAQDKSARGAARTADRCWAQHGSNARIPVRGLVPYSLQWR